jgi:hypothetical protein
MKQQSLMPSKDRLRQINRRVLLKATGVMAGGVTLGSTMFVGLASADPPDEIRFCGCSQVCVSTETSYRIVYASEEGSGYACRVEPGTDEPEPRNPDCYTAGDDEKIIGILGGARNMYYNPNTCAERALNAVDLNDCTGCVDDNCDTLVSYDQVGKHEYEAKVTWGEDDEEKVVTVRTRLCKPPEEWDDDPNGSQNNSEDRSDEADSTEKDDDESEDRSD